MGVVVLHRLRHVDDVSVSVVIPAHGEGEVMTAGSFILKGLCVVGVASYSMLNSLRSAWTSRASWNIFLMFWTTCR